MARNGDDWNEGNHKGHNDAPVKALSAEELRRQNLNAVNDIGFETDENGQASFLGMSIPREAQPLLEPILDQAKAVAVDNSEVVFRKAAGLADTFGIKSLKGQRWAGFIAENLVRWGIIGVNQIVHFVKAGNKYSHERKEIYEAFAPVMEATGASPRNNEGMKIAFAQARENWWSSVKMMFTDIPTLIPMVALGLKEQRASHDRLKNHPLGGHGSFDAAKADIDAVLAADKKRAAVHQEREEIIDSYLKDWEETWVTERKGQKGTIYNRQTYEEEYRQLTEPELRRKFQEGPGRQLREKILRNSEHDDDDHHKNDDKKSSWIKWLVAPGSLISQIWKNSYRKADELRRKNVPAWKLIEHLKQEVDNQCGGVQDCDRTFTSKSADEITVRGVGGKEGKDMSLKDYVLEVFQQHERDRERDKNWIPNGRLIDPLGAPLVARLQPVLDMIAEYIADGRLDPKALHVLVLGEKIIMHKGKGKLEFATEEEARKAIDELVPVLGTREVQKLDEYLGKFDDRAQIQKTIKENLETMKGKEKALFASLFPDDILEQLGLKKKDIVELRKAAHGDLYDFVAANALYLAAKDTEHLKKIGASEKDIQAIHDLAEKIESGDIRALKQAVDGRDKSALDAVRTAGLLEQVKGGNKNYWADRAGAKEMSAAHEKLDETKEKESASETKNEKTANGRIYDSYGKGDVSTDHPDVDKNFAALVESQKHGKTGNARADEKDEDSVRGIKPKNRMAEYAKAKNDGHVGRLSDESPEPRALS